MPTIFNSVLAPPSTVFALDVVPSARCSVRPESVAAPQARRPPCTRLFADQRPPTTAPGGERGPPRVLLVSRRTESGAPHTSAAGTHLGAGGAPGVA